MDGLGVSEENPYAPPSIEEGMLKQQKEALREIVIGWEKLRLLYNVILLVPGLVILALWTHRHGMPMLAALVSAVFVGVGANAAYLLGPLSELYFRGLFRNGESLGRGRWLIFGAGLVVSGGVFLLALMGGLL